jgi:hypothetical protein
MDAARIALVSVSLAALASRAPRGRVAPPRPVGDTPPPEPADDEPVAGATSPRSVRPRRPDSEA